MTSSYHKFYCFLKEMFFLMRIGGLYPAGGKGREQGPLFPGACFVSQMGWGHGANSLQLHGLQPARLLCPWNSLGKNTGLGSYSLLQGDFPNPGIKPESHPLWADSLPSEPPRKPYIWQKAINKVTREGLTVNMEFQGALSCHLP